jgi:hypothetical protein
MLNLAQAASIVCVISLVFAVNGGVADAGLSTNCVAADGSSAPLLVQVKDKKSKKKKHNDGGDQTSGLTECTIQSSGGGGGCKTGFKYVCEKMKSGNKCCGCVATGQGGGDNDNILWRDYEYKKPQPEQGNQDQGTDAAQQKSTQEKADGRFGVDFDAVTPVE